MAFPGVDDPLTAELTADGAPPYRPFIFMVLIENYSVQTHLNNCHFDQISLGPFRMQA